MNHSLLSTLKSYERVPLSNNDINYRLSNGKANIVAYSKLHKYKTLDQLLGKQGYVILLFERKKNYGHWTLIFKTIDGGVEFFNSYNGFPDDSLKYISSDFRKRSNQDHTYLTDLFIKSPYKLSYNEFTFQRKKQDIATCGRWVLLRLFLRDLNLYEFKDFVNKYCKQFNLTPDQLVTFLTL